MSKTKIILLFSIVVNSPLLPMEIRQRAPRPALMDFDVAPVENEDEYDRSSCQKCADWSADLLTMGAGNWLGAGAMVDFMLADGASAQDRRMIHATYCCVPACCLTLATYLKKYAANEEEDTFCSHCPEVLKKTAATGACSGLCCCCAMLTVAASLPPMWH